MTKRPKELNNNNDIVRQKNEEIRILKEELKRVQRLPHMDKARASAIIMQVAAQLAKMPEYKKAQQLQRAVDMWTVYTTRVEAKRDKLFSLLKISSVSLQECLQNVDWHETKINAIRDILKQINNELECKTPFDVVNISANHKVYKDGKWINNSDYTKDGHNNGD